MIQEWIKSDAYRITTEISIREIHLGYVERIKCRGEQVVQPRCNPMGSIDGYDKTIGLISAGSIFKEKDGTFSLLQDMLTHVYTGVKLENIGLCDAKCWYEAIDDKNLTDANKEQAEKLTENKASVPEQDYLKKEYVLEIFSAIIDEMHRQSVNQAHEKQRLENGPLGARWVVDSGKQEFLKSLKIPIEFKKMLGYEERLK